MSELVATIFSGQGRSYLARYLFAKALDQYQAFESLDVAKGWVEGLAGVDSFVELEWIEALAFDDRTALFLTGGGGRS